MKVIEKKKTKVLHCIQKKTYPLASGGNLVTTFPISAPGKSTNFPPSSRC